MAGPLLFSPNTLLPCQPSRGSVLFWVADFLGEIRRIKNADIYVLNRAKHSAGMISFNPRQILFPTHFIHEAMEAQEA